MKLFCLVTYLARPIPIHLFMNGFADECYAVQ